MPPSRDPHTEGWDREHVENSRTRVSHVITLLIVDVMGMPCKVIPVKTMRPGWRSEFHFDASRRVVLGPRLVIIAGHSLTHSSNTLVLECPRPVARVPVFVRRDT